MIIYVEKPNPVTGMIPTTKKTTTVLDISGLDESEQTEIEKLVMDADFFNLPESLVDPNAADFNSYTITINFNGNEHSVTVGSVPPNESEYSTYNKLNELKSKVKENPSSYATTNP